MMIKDAYFYDVEKNLEKSKKNIVIFDDPPRPPVLYVNIRIYEYMCVFLSLSVWVRHNNLVR